jgi:hypothetical protein
VLRTTVISPGISPPAKAAATVKTIFRYNPSRRYPLSREKIILADVAARQRSAILPAGLLRMNPVFTAFIIAFILNVCNYSVVCGG